MDDRSKGGNQHPKHSFVDKGISRATVILANISLRNTIKSKAASRISSFWRRHQWKSLPRLIKRFSDEGMTDRINTVSFEEMVVMLRLRPVIRVTKALLQRVHIAAGIISPLPSGQNDIPNVNVRVFLAHYMTSGKPNHVFEEPDKPLETDLREASVELHECFNKIIDQLTARKAFHAIDADLVQSFLPLLMGYLRKFKLWKIPDEAKLTLRIQHALIALMTATQHLPSDEAPDSRLRVELVTQTDRLRNKLRQIAGPAKLLEFDQNHAQRIVLASVDTPGRIALRYPGGWPVPKDSDNEMLAHQLLRDPGFAIPDGGWNSNSICKFISDQFTIAFWDSLGDDQKLLVPCYVRVHRVLREITEGAREGLTGSSGDRICISVNSAAVDFPSELDMEHFKQMIGANAIDMVDVFGFVSRIFHGIRVIQSFHRLSAMDAKWLAVKTSLEGVTDNITRADAFTNTLRFLLDCVSEYRVDAANRRLRLIAPVIMEHGKDYELGKFNAKRVGRNVDHAEIYAATSVDMAITDGCVTLESIKEGSAAAYIKAMEIGFLDLAFHMEERPIPETFLFDAREMCLLDKSFEFMASIATKFTGFADSLKKNLMQCKGPSEEHGPYVLQCNSDVDKILDFIYEKIEYCDENLEEVIFF